MKFTRLIIVATLFVSFFTQIQLANAAGLTDFKNTPKTIEEYTANGKWLLVMFWASDCHICNKEAHEYVDFHFAHSDTDATVLGISADGKAQFKDAEKFIKKHAIDFPNLIGEPEDVAAIYGKHANSRWIGTPSFLLFNPKGKLMAAQVGAVPPEVIEDFMKKNPVAATDSQPDTSNVARQ